MGLTNLSSLFGRDFVVGFMMPSLLLFFGTLAVLGIFDIVRISYDWFAKDSLIDLAVVTVAVWLLGVVLFLLNHHIIRLLEGYWLINWLWLPRQIQILKFKRLQQRRREVARTWDEHRDRGEEVPQKLKMQWSQINDKKANLYPPEEIDLLPTKLGNVIRAFERYPRIMYGLESIDGWFRLLGVIDGEYQVLLGNAKAALDFWINSCVVFALLVVAFFATATYAGEESYVFGEAYWRGAIADPWLLAIPLVSLILAVASYLAAVSAAVAWGGFVKAAFDLYLKDLATKLGFELPPDLEGRRRVWRQFSKAIAYRNPNNLARAHGLKILRV